MSNFIKLNVYYKGLKEIDENATDLFDNPDYTDILLKIHGHRTNRMTINSDEIRFFEPTSIIIDLKTWDEMPLTKIVLKRKDCFFYIFTDMPYEELRDKVIVTKK